MKISEIRELSQEERSVKVKDLKEELFNFRFRHTAGQLGDTSKLQKTKRDIACIKTVINENKEKKS